MKPYFAKYLPVEGEVKMGDKFLDPELGIGTRRSEEGVYDFQKVKLFLCSKDIKVGDEICDDNDSSEFCEVMKVDGDNLTIIYHGKEETVSRLYTMKVIGEISLKDTWVKEGDAFDEEDIHVIKTIIRLDGKKTTTEHYAKHRNNSSIYKTVNVVHIKGPCGNFH